MREIFCTILYIVIYMFEFRIRGFMGRYEKVWIELVLFLITGWGLVPETVAGSRVQIVGSTTVLPVASR